MDLICSWTALTLSSPCNPTKTQNVFHACFAGDLFYVHLFLDAFWLEQKKDWLKDAEKSRHEVFKMMASVSSRETSKQEQAEGPHDVLGGTEETSGESKVAKAPPDLVNRSAPILPDRRASEGPKFPYPFNAAGSAVSRASSSSSESQRSVRETTVHDKTTRQLFLEKGPDGPGVLFAAETGRSLLHYACLGGREKLVSML